MSVYVFTGPTLSIDEAQAELNAIYLPPVSQGDVYRVGLFRPTAIGIIDGYFDRVPSVWHKEILWAMTQGIHVYGSASMGALRAAELAPFGMEGVGEIFEAYSDGIIEDDDEVAVIHGGAEVGYRSLSVAMVDIRKTLARAETEGVISSLTRATLEDLAKRLFYPERSYAWILQKAAAQEAPAAELQVLNDWLQQGRVEQKRQDALAMLRHMREQIDAKPEPKRVAYEFEHTIFWDDLMFLAGGAERGAVNEGATVTTDMILDELRLRGAAYLQARERGLLRDLALREAQHHGFRAHHGEVRERDAEFRELHGLNRSEELGVWLQENHLNPGGFEELIRHEVLLSRVLAERDPRHWRMLDQLRMSDEYRRLRARAVDKQCRLEAAGLQNPSWEDAGITKDALLHWYFQRLGPFFVHDPENHARTLDFQHVEAFLFAALREFCYLRLRQSDTKERSTEEKHD